MYCGSSQTCSAAGVWSQCVESYIPCDSGSVVSLDGSPGPSDADAPDAGPVATMDARIDPTDTDPYPGDVFSPGSCVWSLGPLHRLTSDPPGGKLLFPLSLGAGGVHLPWTSTIDRNVRVQEIGLDATPLLAPQLLIPTPSGAEIAYGSVAETATRRIALVGPTRGSIFVPLAADDTRAGTLSALYAGRCVDLQPSAGAFSYLSFPSDGTPGVAYGRVDGASGTMLASSVLAADATEAHRTTIEGGALDGQFLVLAQSGASAVTARRFDADGIALASPVALPVGAGTLRGVGPLAVDGGWLVAMQIGEFGLATLALDLDGHPTREPYVLPDVRSTRGLYYGLASARGDAMVVWTEWVSRSTAEVAMHAQPLSLDGFPRGPVIDIGRFPAAGSAPDAIEAIGTSEGVVVVLHAVADPAAATSDLYSTLLTCVAP